MSKRKNSAQKIREELSPPTWKARPAEKMKALCHITVRDMSGALVKNATGHWHLDVIQIRTVRGAVVSSLAKFDYGGIIRKCFYSWADGGVPTQCLRSTRGEFYAKLPSQRPGKEIWLCFGVEPAVGSQAESPTTHVVVSGTRTKEVPASPLPPSCATEQDSDADDDIKMSPCRPKKKARVERKVRASHRELGGVKLPKKKKTDSDTDTDDDKESPLPQWAMRRQQAATALALSVPLSPPIASPQVTEETVVPMTPPASPLPVVPSLPSADSIDSMLRQIEEQKQKKLAAEVKLQDAKKAIADALAEMTKAAAVAAERAERASRAVLELSAMRA